MTPHTKDPPLIEAYQPIHEIAEDPTLSQPIGQLRKPHIRIHPILEDPMEIHTVRGIQDPQMDVYSSEDNSSDSEGDSDHLN